MKSRETFNKKETEKNKEKKRKEKEQRKEERKANKGGSNLEDMLAYVDENGNITSTPPDPTKKKVIREEDIEIGVPRQANRPEVNPHRTGRITFFNDSKGYGFIKDLESQESIFVHINNSLSPLKENDKVSFEVEMGPKGPSAVRVKVV
jgi:cold shock CspA family protein